MAAVSAGTIITLPTAQTVLFWNNDVGAYGDNLGGVSVRITIADTDGDGINDDVDNCQFTANAGQENNDLDAQGDACDPDDDNDSVLDGSDNCQFTANAGQENNDLDAQGDACDPDDDNDSVLDGSDNCQFTANAGQEDFDSDGVGDACDPDIDGDGVLNGSDFCAGTVDPDGVPSVKLGVNRWADTDGDGVFDTTPPKGKGPRRSYTIQDTAGCSAAQIIDELGLGKGHTKFGVSISGMDDWVAFVNP